jgi:hypothetical protein
VCFWLNQAIISAATEWRSYPGRCCGTLENSSIFFLAGDEENVWRVTPAFHQVPSSSTAAERAQIEAQRKAADENRFDIDAYLGWD